MFCKGCFSKVKSILLKIDKILWDKAAIALSITSVLRTLLDSNEVNLQVLLTVAKVDQKLLDKVLKGLEAAMNHLAVTGYCKLQPTLDEKLKCFVNEMKRLHPDLQKSLLIKIASIITAHMDEYKQQESIYDALVQGTYTMNKHTA